MLYPNQFRVNDAWIAFGLNKVPIPTREDGELRFVALMDAASCFLLSAVPTPFASPLSRDDEARGLFQKAWVHKETWPGKLFVADEEPLGILESYASAIGINILHVPLVQLTVFIREAQEEFAEHFGIGKPRGRRISASQIVKARKRV